MSRPGLEDLTFWVNHNGLEQLDVLGEVGFGDMARILMRRRSCALRDRFTFKTHVMSAIQTPDAFSVELTDAGLVWRNHPDRFVVGASQTFNLPLIVANSGASSVRVKAEFIGNTTSSGFPEAVLEGHASAGYFLRVLESEPGIRKGRLLIHAGERELDADVTFDVRPLANLRVNLIDENGRPSAARVYLTGSSGLGCVPPGGISRYTAMSAENFFHADGSFSVDKPSGKTLIEAARGQEYELATRTVDLVPGSAAPVTIQLKRWVDMPAKGWYSSDSHIHANYTADQHQVIDLRDIRLYAYAEDLNKREHARGQ